MVDSPEDMVDSFINMFGKIDILINNAGAVIGPKDILDLDGESWDRTFLLNTKAPFFIAQSAFKHMKNHGGGKIINISSIAAKYGGSEQNVTLRCR